MPGKPIPSWPSDKPFDGLPTFDALQQQTGIKVARLRLLLRGVSRWKCTDNTVRYDPIAAAGALEQWEDDDDDAPANDNASGPANDNAALPGDPTQAAAVIFQRTTLQALQTLQRTLTLQNEVIKAMGEPMRQGMQLVTDAQGVLMQRLEKLEGQQDRMVLVTEDLLSAQAEREQAKQRASNRMAMQREAFDTAKKYFPDVLSKFKVVGMAGTALDLLESIDPDHLAAFVDLGVLSPEKTALARDLIAQLKARRQQQQEGKSDAKQQEPAAASRGTDDARG